MSGKTGSLFVALFVLLPVMALSGEVAHSVNPDNGLRGWNFTDADIQIELIQRLPDQTRALFMNHEFSREVIEQLALSCMFQTIIRNTGKSGTGGALSMDLTEWRVHKGDKPRPILLKEPLLESWSDEDASPAAKLVVRWGMFPTRQEYLAGDYNWGLTAYGIAPGEQFDLEVSWRAGDERHSAMISGIVCAPDVDKLQ
jgi:hypothetical protein